MQFSNLSSFNLGDYLQIMFRRKWLFIIPCGIVFSITTIGSFFLPEIYESRALILIEQRQMLESLGQGMAVPAKIDMQIKTLTEQILSNSRLENMIKEMKLDINIKKGDESQLQYLIASLRKRMVVQPVHGSEDLVEIAFEDKNRFVAQKVVDFITTSFVRETVVSKEAEANSAIDFIRNQLEIYKKKLEESESALRNFKERHLMEVQGTPARSADGEGSARSVNVNVDRAMTYQDELTDINLELESLRKKRDMLKMQLSGQDRVFRFQSKETNPLINRLSDRIVDLQIRLSDLYTRKYTDRHPEVIALKKNIANTEKQLKKEYEEGMTVEKSELNPAFQDLEKQLREVEADIDTLKAREARLIEISNKCSKLILDVPAQEQELIKLTRDSKVNEGIYEMLLQKLETANISQRLETAEKGTRFKVINSAKLPLDPIKPNKTLIAIMGLIIGSIIGFGAVVLGEYTDHSFRNLEDAEAFLRIQSFGSIAKIITETESIENKRSMKIKTILISIILIFLILISYIAIVVIKG